MKKLLVLVIFLVFLCAAPGFSFYIADIGFPFKAFIYSALNITLAERSNITISLQTVDRLNFTYQGKAYKASLFKYGAIYLEREGQNPLFISFDVKEYRMGGRYRH